MDDRRPADEEQEEAAGPQPPRFPWRPGCQLPARDDGCAPHLTALADLGLEGVIDAHCHWFPENVTEKIWSYFLREHWAIAYRCPPEERLAWLRRNGARRFTTLNYAHRPGMAAWLNEWTARFSDEVPEAIPCGTFYPDPDVGAYVRRAIEEYGFRGFKLHLHVGDFDPAQRALDPAWEQVEQARLPVVIHSGNLPTRGRYTEIGHVRRLLERFPRLVLIVAHMGAGEFEDYLDLAERHPGVHLDTTMVFVDFLACRDYPPALLGRLARRAEKLLFGSDFPNIPYPFAHAVESVLKLPFAPAQFRQVFRDNAVRLFGLNVPPPPAERPDGGQAGPPERQGGER